MDSEYRHRGAPPFRHPSQRPRFPHRSRRPVLVYQPLNQHNIYQPPMNQPHIYEQDPMNQRPIYQHPIYQHPIYQQKILQPMYHEPILQPMYHEPILQPIYNPIYNPTQRPSIQHQPHYVQHIAPRSGELMGIESGRNKKRRTMYGKGYEFVENNHFDNSNDLDNLDVNEEILPPHIVDNLREVTPSIAGIEALDNESAGSAGPGTGKSILDTDSLSGKFCANSHILALFLK